MLTCCREGSPKSACTVPSNSMAMLLVMPSYPSLDPPAPRAPVESLCRTNAKPSAVPPDTEEIRNEKLQRKPLRNLIDVTSGPSAVGVANQTTVQRVRLTHPGDEARCHRVPADDPVSPARTKRRAVPWMPALASAACPSNRSLVDAVPSKPAALVKLTAPRPDDRALQRVASLSWTLMLGLVLDPRWA